ncbi:MAG: hypothetical protein PVG84_19255 [Desulfobacterales bacterium]|jgi:hypothetical protein
MTAEGFFTELSTLAAIWHKKHKNQFSGPNIKCLAVNNRRNFVLGGSGLILSKSRAIFIANHSIFVGNLPL